MSERSGEGVVGDKLYRVCWRDDIPDDFEYEVVEATGTRVLVRWNPGGGQAYQELDIADVVGPGRRYFGTRDEAFQRAAGEVTAEEKRVEGKRVRLSLLWLTRLGEEAGDYE